MKPKMTGPTLRIPRPALANAPHKPVTPEPKPQLTEEEEYESHIQSLEKERRLAMDTLAKMCLDDDDVALVVVASPYRRLDDVAVIIDGSICYSRRDALRLLKEAIQGTEVEEFINSEFVEPERRRIFDLCELEQFASEAKARREAYQSGRNEVINRIVNLLKGGKE